MNKIEILAPAGSPEQGYAAIEAGCDAIYGGLKTGNARQRAVNFTLEEYIKILNTCREKHVKFYLTLNTLLKTAELFNTIALLKQIELPDAVIVADIGLITAIRKTFPALPIHASTQFGASSLRDIRFLESLGVTRAILSRELTLNEIRFIKENSQIELEAFVFGTQCIMFSGQCLWGGIVSESSGNRGKCNGMCRDFYRCGQVTGQLLYPRDLEIGRHINALREIGVCSAKLEGRLRAIPEIVKAIYTIKSGELCESYASYLSDTATFPVHGMINPINPRIRYSNEQAEHYTSHDLLYDSKRYLFGNETVEPNVLHYIKTVYHQPLTDGINIALKLKYEKHTLKTIRFLDSSGEKKLFTISDQNTVQMTVSTLCKMLKNNIKYPIYELISEVPDTVQTNVDIDDVIKCCEFINEKCRQADILIQGNNIIRTDRTEFIQTDKVNDIVRFASHGYKHFIFDITSEISLDQVCALPQDIIFRFPMFDQEIDIEKIAYKLVGRKIMLTRISQLQFLHKYQFQEVSADYSMNCWNEPALMFLKNAGITAVAVHPEIALTTSLSIMEHCGITPIVMIAGNIPLGYTRACLGELGVCNHTCQECLRMTNIDKSYDIEIQCTEPSGFKPVYRTGIDIAYKSDGMFEKRIVISRFSEELKSEFLTKEEIVIEIPNYLYRRDVK